MVLWLIIIESIKNINIRRIIIINNDTNNKTEQPKIIYDKSVYTQSYTEDKNIAPPELIDLPVYREDYISQEQVNKACRLLWKEKPYYIQSLISEEKTTRRDNPTQMLGMSRILGSLGYFFREKEESGEIEELSYTGMVDLIYEVERRVRLAIGLDDFKPIGHPIAPTPNGPFPEIGDIMYHVLKDELHYKEYPNYKNKTKPEIPPERNIIYHKLCKEHPEIVFACAEGVRRYQAGTESNLFLNKYFKEHLSQEK